MKLNQILCSGVIGLATLSGCASPGKIELSRITNNGTEYPIQINGIKIIPIIQKNSIESLSFDFDPCFEAARKIQYKPEAFFHDYMQTPQETAKLGTGDCEDFAVYLSKLLSDRRIYNEIVFGQIHKSDGLRFHVWNRVIENSNRYLLDSVAGTRMLEAEVPKGYYNEFTRVKPLGYSRLDMRRYSILAHQNEFAPVLKIIINGDSNKKLFGGRK